MATTHCEWFFAEPALESKPMRPVRVGWLCPTEGCAGEMVATGVNWPMNSVGYHHKCTVCNNILAIQGKTFPRIEYADVD